MTHKGRYDSYLGGLLSTEIIPKGSGRLAGTSGLQGMVPALVARSGEPATKRFIEYFTATIRNPNTRAAYMRAVGSFLAWCEARGVSSLSGIEPILVAAYIESHKSAAPTVKQHLAAVRMLFDWLVTGHVMRTNPAHSVRGPRHVVKRGKTYVLAADEARQLLDSIETDNITGLRDRALIAVMVYALARVSAVIHMSVEDYRMQGNRRWFRFLEKGGKVHEVPVSHKAEAILDEYLQAAGIEQEKKAPLFRSISRKRELSSNPMTRSDVLRMVKRRALAAGLPDTVCCHSFRATGITIYLEHGGTLEKAQQLAAHESPRTTKLYDRTTDKLTLDEVERIIL